MEVVVRPAGRADVGSLSEVERDGDRRYRGYAGVPVGFEDTVAPSILERAAGDGRLWVAMSCSGLGGDEQAGEGEVVGFALAEEIDGQGHLAQVSVRLGYQGHGIGGRLVATVVDWARTGGRAAVTLCTFADVEWNRPLYEHLGFVVLAEQQWTPGLRSSFEDDGRLGLDLDRRVVMRLDLSV